MGPKDTVKIASDLFEGGFVVINADDYEADIDVLYTEPEPEAAAAQAAVAAQVTKRKKG